MRVKANKGPLGVDEESIQAFEANLKGNLYKVWNRMSSGSYMPPPVRAVQIPKWRDRRALQAGVRGRAEGRQVVAVNDALGGEDALVFVVDVSLNVVFWWWSMHFLLNGRRTWRYLLPAALATALFWLGLRVFSTIFITEAMISNENEYGSIGVVFILMAEREWPSRTPLSPVL